jgi:tetratricopeptide (TPR) repeat protein
MSGIHTTADENRLAASFTQPVDGFELHLPAPDDTASSHDFAASGRSHYANCQFDRAIADFDQAIALDPQNAEAYNARGLAYYAIADLRRAIADFDEALSLNPEIADAYYNRGSAFCDRGQHERAIADFNRALAIDPGLRLAEARKWMAEENLAAQKGKMHNGPRKGLLARLLR